ncbi:hypothetical protein SASPL_151695 [Salvia splendens]|uniref:Disease resistance protein RPM1 n=1 Tax=Salvia splendens TaxID=180675 RepID=A0A8X8W250_SALSN|nr:hypothetical protein SASPL_151695 [Salvia splendens]
MPYGAVISVLKTLDELQFESRFQKIQYPGSEVRTLQNNLTFLKNFLKREPPGITDLEAKIRETMYDAEDVLDSNLSNFILNSESATWDEDNYISSFTQALEEVNTKVDSIAETARTLSPHADRPLLLMPPVPEVSRRSLIVGREKDFIDLKYRLTAGSASLQTVPVLGIRGIGKTHLAQTVYDDPDVVSMFKMRAWVEVSLDYSKKEILLGLLRSMRKLGSGKGQEIAEDDLARRLSKVLSLGNYLVVLDDVCNPEAWDNLRELFPDWHNGSRVMLTTTQKKVAENGGGFIKEIRPLDGDEPWALLQSVVFRYKACPEKLVATAKRVSDNCKGLPLAIVTIGGVLMEAGPNDWEIAASSLTHCGNSCDDLIDSVMSLSYKSLPKYAKACLLYMGIFPNNYDIPLSKLFKLWIAEGFIDKNEQFNSLEKMADGCLSLLVERGIVVVSERNPVGKIKTCRVDGVYYEFLKKKAEEEEKFFHVVDSYTTSFPDDTWTHERFSIRVNIQFAALDAAQDLSFLSHLTLLASLESFKCVVMHPDFTSQVASPNPIVVSFPATLTKISLSGCGLSWDNMKAIATLPKLESLKLRWYAFRGSEWNQKGDGKDFPRLRFLLLEDLDIQWWKAGSGHFPWLTNLVIRHCYKLQEIPAVIGNIPTLKKIELVDCNSSAQRCAQEIKMDRQSRGYIRVDFHSSRDD